MLPFTLAHQFCPRCTAPNDTPSCAGVVGSCVPCDGIPFAESPSPAPIKEDQTVAPADLGPSLVRDEEEIESTVPPMAIGELGLGKVTTVSSHRSRELGKEKADTKTLSAESSKAASDVASTAATEAFGLELAAKLHVRRQLEGKRTRTEKVTLYFRWFQRLVGEFKQ